MRIKVARLNLFARLAGTAAFALVCLAATPAAYPQISPDRLPPPSRPIPPTVRRDPVPPIKGDPPPSGDRAPTMKKPDALEVPPSRARRSYDPRRDATYVNVDITLLAHREVKEPKGALRFEGREVKLIFQLAYRGAQTYDLISAYLIVESMAAPTDADKLSAVRRLEIKADPYEYSYERFDYQTELIAPVGALTQQLRREVAAFKLPPEDLPQYANAGRLLVKFGAETFTVKSPQLSELRRTISAGASP